MRLLDQRRDRRRGGGGLEPCPALARRDRGRRRAVGRDDRDRRDDADDLLGDLDGDGVGDQIRDGDLVSRDHAGRVARPAPSPRPPAATRPARRPARRAPGSRSRPGTPATPRRSRRRCRGCRRRPRRRPASAAWAGRRSRPPPDPPLTSGRPQTRGRAAPMPPPARVGQPHLVMRSSSARGRASARPGIPLGYPSDGMSDGYTSCPCSATSPISMFSSRHPQRDEQPDELEQDERAERRPADHPGPAKNCHFSSVQLPWIRRRPREPVAIRTPSWRWSCRRPPCSGRRRRRSADRRQTGEPVGVDHAERVVDVAERPQPAQVVEREVHDRRRRSTPMAIAPSR